MAAGDFERLEGAFRRRQLGLQAGAGLIISKRFAQIPPEEVIAPSSPAVDAWLKESTAVTLGMRRRAAAEARTFYDEVQAIGAPGTPRIAHEEPALPDVEQVHTSLMTTGVVRARAKIAAGPRRPGAFGKNDLTAFFDAQRQGDTPGKTLLEKQRDVLDSAYPANVADAMKSGGDAAGAAAARHVGNGAREQIQDSAKRDRRSIGYIRILGPAPCYFCAMLASRGPVFSVDSFDDSDMLFDGAGHHKVHDNCGCSMRQVYSRATSEYPQTNIDLELRWKTLSEELKRSPSMQEWRNHYDGSTARKK